MLTQALFEYFWIPLDLFWTFLNCFWTLWTVFGHSGLFLDILWHIVANYVYQLRQILTILLPFLSVGFWLMNPVPIRLRIICRSVIVIIYHHTIIGLLFVVGNIQVLRQHVLRICPHNLWQHCQHRLRPLPTPNFLIGWKVPCSTTTYVLFHNL